MTVFDFESLEAAPLSREPFAFAIVPNFVRPEAFQKVAADFPHVPGPGSFPPGTLRVGAAFRALLDELNGPRFQRAIEDKFDIDLEARPKMLTIRGHTRWKDGGVHTDTATKLITVLLYMNADWTEEGGRLHLLRSKDLDDSLAEIAPVGGTLVVFRRADNSWHGHLPYEGARHVIQFNWVTTREVALRERTRHMAAAYVKKIGSILRR